MNREFEPRVTNAMAHAGTDIDKRLSVFKAADIFKAMTAHPDFRAQLRAWAAEEMRGLVPPEVEMTTATNEQEAGAAFGSNYCRAETLANIAKWEQQP